MEDIHSSCGIILKNIDTSEQTQGLDSIKIPIHRETTPKSIQTRASEPHLHENAHIRLMLLHKSSIHKMKGKLSSPTDISN